MKILVTGAAGSTPSFVQPFDREGVAAHLGLSMADIEEGNP